MKSEGTELLEQVASLAEKIQSGEVAFFVGAGFSLDSEQNSTTRLQLRLLRRFDAMSHIFGHSALRETFALTFGLTKILRRPIDSCLHPQALEKLKNDYYPLNDWMCAAFARMLEDLYRDRTQSEPKLGEVYNLERLLNDYVELWGTRRQELLRTAGSHPLKMRGKPRPKPWIKPDPVPLSPIQLDELESILDPLARGKALFLETLGFSLNEIMAGDPYAADPYQVRLSYALRPCRRHEILARLAREGLCPQLVTTNYDLLIEGAYRLAGLEWRASAPRSSSFSTHTPYFSVVGGPLEFFDLGDGTQSALILKMHGCAHTYRRHKQQALENNLEGNGTDPLTGANNREAHSWERYLPSIVYTYREIQNWREDSWSRDFLRTLLRTRTLVLCGYSVVDTVVHDTFRTVYEELAHHRRTGAPALSAAPQAPAFFMGPSGTWEFHGVEILRAATQATGAPCRGMSTHPNYLQFELERGLFPSLDDLFVWVFHRIQRARQQQALQSELRRVANQVLGSPPPDGELETLETLFNELVRSEQTLQQSFKRDRAATPKFNALTQWTDQFHPALMRQQSLAQALTLRHSTRRELDDLRRIPSWYYPVCARPDWCAWNVVLEIALRRVIANEVSDGSDWHSLPGHVEVAAQDGVPSVTWQVNGVAAALALAWEGDPTPVSRRCFPGAPRWRRVWRPALTHLPWPREGESPKLDHFALKASQAPCARHIWNWALGRNLWTEPPEAEKQDNGATTDQSVHIAYGNSWLRDVLQEQWETSQGEDHERRYPR